MRFFRNSIFTILLCLAHLVSQADPLPPSAMQGDTSVSGYTDALNFNMKVLIAPEFIGNDSKLWFAVVRAGEVYFLSETAWFSPYPGGLAKLLSNDRTEAPAYRAIASRTETISITGWNTRSILGGELYVGYGSSFGEMINAGRYLKIYSLYEKFPSVEASESLFYCYARSNFSEPIYVAFKFRATNFTNYVASTVFFETLLYVPGQETPIGGNYQYTIPGGLAPGATIVLNLVPSVADSFSTKAAEYCGVSTSTRLDVKLYRATDTGGVVHNYQ